MRSWSQFCCGLIVSVINIIKMTNVSGVPINGQSPDLTKTKTEEAGEFPLLTNIGGGCRIWESETQVAIHVIAGGENSSKTSKVKYRPSSIFKHQDIVDVDDKENQTEHDEMLRNVEHSLSKLKERKYVIIDVGGERFRADRNTFLRFPLMTCVRCHGVTNHKLFSCVMCHESCVTCH